MLQAMAYIYNIYIDILCPMHYAHAYILYAKLVNVNDQYRALYERSPTIRWKSK